ncbi:hypothetical protein AAFC00_004949 [Neodothiora populina]|uniref:CipC-like antibiotic response protein n=1 Tax=Neodothiora populina TaxID=2781224 RepID=A0ABR3P411_9PEZI
MFGWDNSKDSYEQAYNDDGQPKNESSLSHEVLAGGASFAAMKAFEDRQRSEGKPIEHQFAKELIAGFAGAEIDKLAETKGEDEWDKQKAKHDAKKNAEAMYDEQYGQYDQYDPNSQQPHENMQKYGNW